MRAMGDLRRPVSGSRDVVRDMEVLLMERGRLPVCRWAVVQCGVRTSRAAGCRPRRAAVVRGRSAAVQPPSIAKDEPVIEAEAGPQRKATRSATSAGSISRLTATGSSSTFSSTSASGMPWLAAWSAICFSTSGVRT